MAKLELTVPHELGAARAIRAIKTAGIVPGDGWNGNRCTFNIPISGFQVGGEGNVLEDQVCGHLDLPDELEPKRDRISTNIENQLKGLFGMMSNMPDDDE